MYYEKPENFKEYDPSKWVLTITSSELDGPLVVDGLHTFTGSKTNPKITITEANSGMATPNISHSKTGEFTFEVWESSPSNLVLDQLIKSGSYVSFTCTNPTLPMKNVSSTYAFFEKPGEVKGDKEVGAISYKLICVNYKASQGSSEAQ